MASATIMPRKMFSLVLELNEHEARALKMMLEDPVQEDESADEYNVRHAIVGALTQEGVKV